MNSEELAWIIGAVGWPTILKVGEAGAHGAWLIAMHANHDPDFQRVCLKRMKACDAGTEVSAEDLAALEAHLPVKNGVSD